MRTHAETDRCRSDLLVGHVGEQVGHCAVCGNCRAGVVPDEAAGEDAALPLQTEVEHAEFGRGVVTDVEEDRITLLFDDVGYRTLSLELVDHGGLLRRAEH